MLLWLLALFFVRFEAMVFLENGVAGRETGTGSKKRNAANVADRGCFDG